MRCILRLWDTYLAEDSAATASTGVGSALMGSGGTSGGGGGGGGGGGAFSALSPGPLGAFGSGPAAAAGACSPPQLLAPQDHYNGFRAFHIYLCAAFLLRFSPDLRRLDFQELVLFLQRLPTDEWTEKDVDTLLAQAFIYKRYDRRSARQARARSLLACWRTALPLCGWIAPHTLSLNNIGLVWFGLFDLICLFLSALAAPAGFTRVRTN